MGLKPEIAGELRTMVREVLRETMAKNPAAGLSAVENVRIACDSDLEAFVQRLLDPAVQERVKGGKLRFLLQGAASAATSGTLTGVIGEKSINKHAGAGTIVLAPDAVLTPLGRDRARKLGLKIERRR